MENLYTSSKLLSSEDFQKLETKLEKAWVKETAFPDDADKWLEANKAFGQCAPTSLVINDLYGGRMIYDKTNFHIWNELPDGTQQDFSRSQFKEDRVFTVYKYKTKDEMLNDETGVRTDLLGRYKLLKKRFDEIG